MKLYRELPLLFWAWCYALQLELSCKDAFTSELFNEILLRLCYLYSKSPKKLTVVVNTLKRVFEFSEGVNAPICS